LQAPGYKIIKSFEGLSLERKEPLRHLAHKVLLRKCFPIPGHFWTSVVIIEVGLDTELAADLDVIQMMMVLQTCKMQKLWGYGGFHQDFKGKTAKPVNELQGGSEFLQADSERMMYNTMRVRSKPQWRLQDIGEGKNVVHLEGKDTGSVKSQPKRDPRWPADSEGLFTISRVA
jgi:hypothetical protein